ncbi:ricin-type beta-trefoil lectin domain protein [Streptomyces sp. AK02-01A]|uniref:ricin-type beta-trefoil lectin domain protein n=1 Tax=Streptomyces sp. AK02-01A TaxID=3028648 RepID=UPI0029AAA992|nr:ricin-type beta-trefoil lectin domain protein [Streptomyces sp. AK02-01A]MDX3850290.1 ricin-type beta-trefoil lectin domain protein [Streptomyces sp. AK02-01A]
MSAQRTPDANADVSAAGTAAARAAGAPVVRQAVALPGVSGAPNGALRPAPERAPRTVQNAAMASTAPAEAAPAPAEAAPVAAPPGAEPGEEAPVAATAGRAAPPDVPAADTEEPPAPGRPKKPLLAAAAIAGALLVAVAFLMASDGSGKDRAAVATRSTDGTVLQDIPPGGAEVYTAESPSPSASPGHSVAPTRPPSGGEKAKPATAAPQAEPEKKAAARKAPAPTREAAPPAAKASTAGRALVSAQSGKCLSAVNGKDGSQLQLWPCDGSAAQRWDFRADGTIRAMGLCMDVAGGSTANSTAIQVAVCSGNGAQQFYLNDTEDLVARSATKCVDIYDGRTGNGTPAILWPCTGTKNQTWTLG